MHPKMRGKSKRQWIMQEFEDEDNLFAKLKTRFKTLRIIYLRKMAYICARDLARK